MTDTPRCDVHVFCLNLRFGRAEDGRHSWKNRRAAYPELLSRYPSDFFGFQEAMDFQIDELRRLLNDHGVIGQRTPAPDHWQNNVIFYDRRWECLDHRHFFLSDTPEVPSKFKASRWPRQCTMGLFQRDGRRIAVVNTHFDFKPEVQHRSAVLILEQLDRLAWGCPTIVMGDFNAGPESSCVQALMSAEAPFQSALWPPAGGTFHGFNGVAQGDPIDWILYRGDVIGCGAKIVDRAFDGILPSDHFPLTAGFRFRTGS